MSIKINFNGGRNYSEALKQELAASLPNAGACLPPDWAIKINLVEALDLSEFTRRGITNTQFEDDKLNFITEGYCGTLYPAQKRGEFQLKPNKAKQSLEDIARFVFVWNAPEADLTYVHASAVLIEGAAHIFAGYSKNGKTTMANLLKQKAGAKIIHDDQIFIDISEGKPVVQNIPFFSFEEARDEPKEIPIKAIYTLVKDAKSFLKPISQAEIFAALFTVPINYQNFKKPEETALYMKKTMPKVGAIVSKTNNYEAHFTLTAPPPEIYGESQ